MTRTSTSMRTAEIVNCYCFNPSCSRSIFYPETCIVIKQALDQVLSKGEFCKICQSELIAKLVLEMKYQIYKALMPEEEHHPLKFLLQSNYKRYIIPEQD